MRILNQQQRDSITALCRAGCFTQSEMAEMSGTTQSNVSKILKQARRSDPEIPRRRSRKNRRKFNVSQMGSRREPMDLDLL